MKLKQAYIICLFVFVLLCFILPGQGRFDIEFWINWVNGMRNVGLAHAYTIPTLNYNPLYLYVLRVYAALMPDPYDVGVNINYLKIFTLLFDFGAVMLLMQWVHKHGRNFFSAFFVLFNIAYLYNTLYWGQVDAIHTTLIFVAFVLAFEQKLVWSVVLFLLAMNTKTQSILFLPILGMLWLPLLKGNGKEVLKGIGLLVVIQLVIILPFLLKGTAGAVWQNYIGVVDYNTSLSMHAYNYWYLMQWDNAELPRLTSDKNLWMGVTYKTWGLLMFFGASLLTLLPLLLKTINKTLQGTRFAFANAEQFFLTTALIAVIFFYFPTQMHERYSHPALLFAGAYFVLSKRWVIFLFISYAYMMNLEVLDKCWAMRNYKTLIFDARLISLLYAAAMLIGIYRLYKDYGIKADWQELQGRIGTKKLAPST
jgi:Gpi18-like mannosyltransferase